MASPTNPTTFQNTRNRGERYYFGILLLSMSIFVAISMSQTSFGDLDEAGAASNDNETSKEMDTEDEFTLGLPLAFAPRKIPPASDTLSYDEAMKKMIEYYGRWNVAVIQVKDSVETFLCAGIIIHPGIALAPDSCFDNSTNVKELFMQFSIGDYPRLKVEHFVGYPGRVKGSFYNDIAVIQFEDPVLLEQVHSNDYPHFRLVTLNPYHSHQESVLTGYFTNWDMIPQNETVTVQRTPTMPSLGTWVVPENSSLWVYTGDVKIISRTLCEELYKNYFDKHYLNFTKTFPKGIDRTLRCASTDLPVLCSRNKGQILILPTKDEMSGDGDGEPLTNYGVVGLRAVGSGPIPNVTNCPGDENYLPAIYTSVDEFAVWATYLGKDLHTQKLIDRKQELDNVYWKSHPVP